jgi:hypothetical protein
MSIVESKFAKRALLRRIKQAADLEVAGQSQQARSDIEG